MAIDYFVTNLQIKKPNADKNALDKHAFEIQSTIISMGPHGAATFITSLGCIIQWLKAGLVEKSGENGKYLDDLCGNLRNVTKSEYR